MATVITDDMSGQQCVFTSKNTADPKTYRGQIEAIKVSYRIANAYFDVAAYNAAARQADATIPQDPTAQQYFIITLTNADGSSTATAFCESWIQDGSFSLVDPATVYNVTVYSAKTNAGPDIVTVLRLAGYQAFVASVGTATTSGATSVDVSTFLLQYQQLLASSPTSDPHVSGQPWNDNGTLAISNG